MTAVSRLADVPERRGAAALLLPFISLVARVPPLRRVAWRWTPRSGLQRVLVVELARWLYARFNSRSVFPTFMFSRDVEAHQARELLDSNETFRGRSGLGQMMSKLNESFGALRFDPEEIYEIGDRLGFVVIAHATIEGRGSGAAVDRRVAHVYRVVDGTITRLDVYWEPAEGLAAAESLTASGDRAKR